jgi:hypothetical protein
MTWTKLQHWATGLSASTMIVLGAAVALVLVVALITWLRVKDKSLSAKIRMLIMLGTLMATSVQASGMWRFFGQTMHLTGAFKIGMFPFLEILLLAFGLQARRKAVDGEPFGVYALMVWVLAVSSGAMSATDASGTTEGVFRVLVAVIVSLLWTLELADEWRRAKKAKAEAAGETPETVRWRFSLKELGVKLGFADAADTSIVGRDANRRMDRYMRASDLVSALSEADQGWLANMKRQRAAKAKGRLLRHARLHADPTALMTKLGASAVDDALGRLGITAAEQEKAAAEEAAAELAAVKAEAAQLLEAEREAAKTAVANAQAAAEARCKELAEVADQARAELTKQAGVAGELDTLTADLNRELGEQKLARRAAETAAETAAAAAEARYEELARVVSQVRAELAKRAGREAELEKLVGDLRLEVGEQSLARRAAETALEGERVLAARTIERQEQEAEALRTRQAKLETRLDAARAQAAPRRRREAAPEGAPNVEAARVEGAPEGAPKGAPEAFGASAPDVEAARVEGAPEASGAAERDDKSAKTDVDSDASKGAPIARRASRKVQFETGVEDAISSGDLRAFSEDSEVRNSVAYEVNASLSRPLDPGTARRYMAEYLSVRPAAQGAPNAEATRVEGAPEGAPEAFGAGAPEAVVVLPAQQTSGADDAIGAPALSSANGKKRRR